jgi:nucleoside diphosphate kinase
MSLLADFETRLWYGTECVFPLDPKLSGIGYCFCFLKPDSFKLDLDKQILNCIKNAGAVIKLEKFFFFQEDLVFKMYPGLHSPSWADELSLYLCSGKCLALLIDENGKSGQLIALRNKIRQIYQVENKIANLMHVSENSDDSVKESLLIFNQEEILSVFT